MILRAMLQRLYASLTSGPGLNARPHYSRQRLDLLELRHLGRADLDPATMLSRLLAQPGTPLEFPAALATFEAPDAPEDQWSDAQRASAARWNRQTRLLQKIREIAADAADYFNDHGEHALYLGFPLVSIPPNANPDRQSIRTPRILAPLALVPIQLQVRRGASAGIALAAAADGADLLQPNPALLAWLEQQTGTGTDALFADDAGEDPWTELEGLLELVTRALRLAAAPDFDADTPLVPIPGTENLPEQAAILPCAVLGLFPVVNPGLLRDTKWMLDQESILPNPTRLFLVPEALETFDTLAPRSPAPPVPNADEATATTAATAAPPPISAPATGPAPSPAPTPAPGARDVRSSEDTWLVASADPCQAAAVAHARASDALVVHGPPGTGKSQTIANIIGDHLARGQRVLFVCDKRTALDVVKYRLDALGLGPLCGVIHDPQRDRRDFYVGLRDRLEALAADAVLPDPTPDLEKVDSRIAALRAELQLAFRQLHDSPAPGGSFHELCGRWLALDPARTAVLPDIDGFLLDQLEAHRTDATECLERARRARWAGNPYRDRLGLELPAYLALPAGRLDEQLHAILPLAERLEAERPTETVPLVLDGDRSPADLAVARRRLADLVEAVLRRGPTAAWPAAADPAAWTRWREEARTIGALAPELAPPLERDLVLALNSRLPDPAETARHLVALEAWQPIAERWTRHFALGRKSAARAAVTPLALDLSPARTDRALRFYRGLRSRLLWNDLRQRLGEAISPRPAAVPGTPGAPQGPLPTGAGLPPDETLQALRESFAELDAALAVAGDPAHAPAIDPLRRALSESPERAGAALARLIGQLRASADHAERLHAVDQAIERTGLFLPTARRDWCRLWHHAPGAAETVRQWLAYRDTLEESIRLTARLRPLPAPLRGALESAIDLGLDPAAAEPALQALGLSRELRRRLREEPDLASIDSRRIEAALAELSERWLARLNLARQRILHQWQDRWRSRLLASTGSRLNSLGASLRQRLFVRGQKAMKLRPMIAAGADTEGGDPLFDLCPVWMASPATVAQIFPRQSLFDTVIFDEASQCRLEEALPVLLRARRVVIAGDPRQLPPTRFFEQALAESAETSPESAEEVFQHQQSEAEDLLSAALNLNVQEAFLDVHYRSRHEALIGFSNAAFYGGRLQPIPTRPGSNTPPPTSPEPKRTAPAAGAPRPSPGPKAPPIRLVRVDGTYADRGNAAEAEAAARLVAELLDRPDPPSIGVACFNLPQRDLILEAIEDLAAANPAFAGRLEIALQRRGRDTFEGLFVKNLENVQGDERDHLILSTTFGPDAAGRFRRNFGALSRAGGERRLNVLVTRAREAVHILTSIPREEYASTPIPASPASGASPRSQSPQGNGRDYLYAYLRYAELLGAPTAGLGPENSVPAHRATPAPTGTVPSSAVADGLAARLAGTRDLAATPCWGNEGFCIDLVLADPANPDTPTVGVLADFNRYRKTPDPIAWEQFRTSVFAAQGWSLHRVWTPQLFRALDESLQQMRQHHHSRRASS